MAHCCAYYLPLGALMARLEEMLLENEKNLKLFFRDFG